MVCVLELHFVCYFVVIIERLRNEYFQEADVLNRSVLNGPESGDVW